ncbi:Uncharacterised protein [Yersinia massiliensis]|nr:Uncharacterised protein [Yersinia massiliensis]
MIITFNQMLSQRHLQWDLVTNFAALLFPPAFQAITAFFRHALIHHANISLLLKCGDFFRRMQLDLTN